jgi:hypothetical protein
VSIATNQEIVADAFQKIGVVDETAQPSPAQAQTAMRLLNDNLLSAQVDGMRTGWYYQNPITAYGSASPLRDADVGPVKLILAGWLLSHYQIKIDPQDLAGQQLLADILDAKRMLTKRALLYVESDLGELSRPQGGPWGGPNWL